jgi:hypothetical protein
MSGLGGPTEPSRPQAPDGMGLAQTPVQTRHGRVPPSTVVSVVLAAILIVLATVLILNGGALPLPRSHSTSNPVFILIDGIHRAITYRGNWTGYFGPTQNDSCGYCPMGAEAGSAVLIPLITLDGPKNLTYWIFYNITGPFLEAASSCSGANCTIPWVRTFSYSIEDDVPGLNQTIWHAFLMPNTPLPGPNIIQFNATICPTSICPPST